MTNLETALISVSDLREELRSRVFEAPTKWRILFIGRSFNGPTDIVASLQRSLEGLGHTVFALDTMRHSDLIDAPTGATAGYGPVYVKFDEIGAILDRFQPQIVILCAYGMVLKESDMEMFRRRGVLTVGLTLSDPDVQPSVIDHTHRFDYHTTNAVNALVEYQARGLVNTFLMPFAVDRSIVTERVSSAPEFAADVICLGHAVGRPERQEFMSELSHHFKVRCYGQGWGMPESRPVRGLEQIQAARSALFHVNFPGTVAGHTNVKVGVFESVAAGAVLCTREFEEMKSYFDYETEILAYSDPHDLIQRITGLDEVQREAMRRRAFHRLVNSHLYEHRWLNLFDEIEQDLASTRPAPGTERASQLRERLAESHGRPKKMIVSGFYGAENIGDDLILEAIGAAIDRDVVDANVVVACTNPRLVERSHGWQAFDRRELEVAEVQTAGSSAVILGGGGLWHDYTFSRAGGPASLFTGATISPTALAQIPLLASIHGHPFHVYGMGVGPLDDPDARKVVRFTAEHADSVVVRDQQSADILRSIGGWTRQVEIAPDPVYGLELPEGIDEPELRGDTPVIALNLRPWDDANSPHFLAHLKGVITDLRLDTDFLLVGVPMMRPDYDELNTFFAGLPDNVKSVLLPWRSDFPHLVGILRRSSVIVAMRLHTSVIAHRLGVPCIGIAYDPKVTSHFEQLDRASHVMGLGEVSSKLPELIRGQLGRRLSATAIANLSRLESEAQASLRRLTAQLASREPTAPVVSRIRQEFKAQPSPIPHGWDPADTVDLRSGRVAGGNIHTGRICDVQASWLRSGLNVRLRSRELAEGDFVSWTVSIAGDGESGRRVEMCYRQPNVTRPRSWERMVREILIDSEVVHSEDALQWGERITTWVAWGDVDSHEIEIRVRAVRELTGLNWGWLGALTIEAVRSQAWELSDRLLLGTSSPQVLSRSAG